MPQLAPEPWLPILVLSWTVFLTVVPPKVLAHSYPNQPAPQNTEKILGAPWLWPWH
uniref:ATP synthase complex subunit 8 n=1 Tax=Sphyraena pinguis TaxID=392540 RepID=A0A7D5FM08_9TELE|nr:ATP synthase F0 subunit 8 [Sphyraena pinguis]QLF67972.1 ATP synthase F0 subunit 8 [Sphyraena pinguis]